MKEGSSDPFLISKENILLVLKEFRTLSSPLTPYYLIKAQDSSIDQEHQLRIVPLPSKDYLCGNSFAIEQDNKWYFYSTYDDEDINNFIHLLNISQAEIDVRLLDMLRDMDLNVLFDFTPVNIPQDFDFNTINLPRE